MVFGFRHGLPRFNPVSASMLARWSMNAASELGSAGSDVWPVSVHQAVQILVSDAKAFSVAVA